MSKKTETKSADEIKKGEMPPQFAKKDAKKDGDGDGKTDGDGDGDDGDGDEDDEDGEKSLNLSTDDLEKSLQKLSDFTQSADPAARKAALLSKAATSELSKDEKDELFKSLGGETTKAEKPLAQDLQKSMDGGAKTAEALDVSGYLKEQHDSLTKSLELLGEYVEKSDKRQSEFNLLLARTVGDLGQLTKSLAKSIDSFGAQPARAAKSAGVQGNKPTKVLNKSFGGSAEQPEFTPAQLSAGLDRVVEKGFANQNGLSKSGEDLTVASSKFEQFGEMSKSLYDEVVAELRSGAAH